MNLLMSLMFIMSFILLTLNHPLSMGMILIIQTLITATIMGLMMKSFFFSYIIIIIMLSGALVLFIYMASVASNEKFKSPVKTMLSSFIIQSFVVMYLYKNNTIYYTNNLNNNDVISLIKMFNMITAQMTIMMIIYLLFTMIVVSNIVKVHEGPLRTSIKYE
uniref:NADH-ubiquinone oxidoreductase chain 6 n=1 Tax=Dinorhynchus dybowskyi TaxID=2082689 RepID=A0A3G1NGU4_9HEMI|nr:NADH dehydrogenase subunit 6 [Dinorhynchus dybowskyi]AVA07537.1 NADH dehydrogenase subunit 6 [Dinorhynchus dybowskyi]